MDYYIQGGNEKSGVVQMEKIPIARTKIQILLWIFLRLFFKCKPTNSSKCETIVGNIIDGRPGKETKRFPCNNFDYLQHTYD